VSNGTKLPPSTAPFAPGALIHGYRLEEQIGRGGMAVVFRAHDERLNRQVALKILAPAPADDEAFRSRFIRESQAAAAVDDPNIIPVYEAGEAGGVLFIAMRLVRGGNLKTLVDRRGPLSPRRAEWIVSAVASALDTAHASGLVHRDVKPANILLDARPGRPDHVYLSDFGVSKAALSSSGLTGSGQFLGTVDYAAPEQIHGHPVDGRTDQYALGCSAFELLAGRPPFFDKHWLAAVQAHLNQPAPALTSLRPELPAAVDGVFDRVLAKSPADRFETCQDFARALATALGVQPYAVDELADPGQSLIAGPDRDDATLDPAVARRQAVVTGSGAQLADSASQRPASAPPVGTIDRTAPARTAGVGQRARVTPSRQSLTVVYSLLAAVLVLAAAAVIALLLVRAPAPKDRAPAAQNGKPVLQQVTITPATLHLAVGKSRELTLHGSVAGGTSAPAADLAGAVWASSNPAVAAVNSRGEVVGKSPGVTRVIVHIGSLRAVAVVTVGRYGAGRPGPGYVYPPPAGYGTSPASSPPLTTSPSASTAPSPSGTPSPTTSASPTTSPVQSSPPP